MAEGTHAGETEGTWSRGLFEEVAYQFWNERSVMIFEGLIGMHTDSRVLLWAFTTLEKDLGGGECGGLCWEGQS
jgi:hypothetical protein